MRRSLFVALLVLPLTPDAGSCQPTFEWIPVPTEERSRLGWTPEGLDALRRFADSIGTSALLVLTDGQTVESMGDITHRYRAHSIRKSLLSALIGIAVAAGQIDTTSTLAELSVSDQGGLRQSEQRATVLHLLQARSGVYHPAASETADMKDARPERESHEAGTFWYYNNWDFNALGTIFGLRTGGTIGEAFYQQIAIPIGMEDYGPGDFEYHHEPALSDHPSYRFRLSARDLARFGTLFLHDGLWGPERIVPAPWVAASTTLRSTTDQSGTKSGYGLMWWVTKDGDIALPGGSFTASGSGGQRLTVLPEIATVVVHMMDTDVRGGPRIGTSTYNALLSTLLAARSR